MKNDKTTGDYNPPLTVLDPEVTLDLVLESLGELVDFELGVVLGLDRQGDLRVRKAIGPLYTPALEDFRIDLSRRRDLAEILERKVPHLYETEADHVDTYQGILDLPEGHSCLVAPLWLQDRTMGLLTFDHRACRKYPPAVVRFVGAMSRLISLALAQSERNQSLETANRTLLEDRNRLIPPGEEEMEGLVGGSEVWKRVLDQIRLTAVTDLPVLIRGETGTGKEGVARAIHRLSPRGKGPFVAVNCSALSESLAEGELFGHEKGAFTGAVAQRRGRFELADGGTLFLDEIGDLPLNLQPKLLRVLQEGVLDRLGGEKSLKVDVRIVAATHVDLEKAITAGKFREDLFYRLHVFPLQVPPLRERRDDILPLAGYFLERIRQRRRLAGLACTPKALSALEIREWPGNVRELENTLERAVILSGGGTVDVIHLGEPYISGVCPDVMEVSGNSEATPPAPGMETWEEGSRRIILRALESAGGRIYGRGGAAEILGLKPTTLQSKMEKLGLRQA